MIANNGVDVRQSANLAPKPNLHQLAQPSNVRQGGERAQNGESPCVSVCVMDDESGFCMGCWRSLSEIATWSQLGVAARVHVNAQLAGRAALHPVLAGRTSN